jgi:hypothetical protein
MCSLKIVRSPSVIRQVFVEAVSATELELMTGIIYSNEEMATQRGTQEELRDVKTCETWDKSW